MSSRMSPSQCEPRAGSRPPELHSFQAHNKLHLSEPRIPSGRRTACPLANGDQRWRCSSSLAYWRHDRTGGAIAPTMGVRVADLFATLRCRAIDGCPGRWVLEVDPDLAPAELVGADALVARVRLAAVRDEVWIAALVDGGLISYRRPDGTFLHTLATPEGFARKLAALGVDLAALPKTTAGDTAHCELAIGDELDLHRFVPADVRALVDEWLGQAAQRGMREVRIIHGKGRGVQRDIVTSLLGRHPAVATWRPGREDEGGWGATVVTLLCRPVDESG